MRTVEREIPLGLTDGQYRQRILYIMNYEAVREQEGPEAALRLLKVGRGDPKTDQSRWGVVPITPAT
jgi:hypothetical protein